MKRFLILATLAALLPLAGFAIDANQLHYVEILPAQASTLEKTDLLLLGPVSNTNGGSTAGSAINVSTYEGYGVIVAGLGARSAAGDTSTVAVVYGFTASPATALVTFTQTTATAKFESYEFDFDTLQGTNAALYLKATFANVEGDTTPMIGSAVLVYDAARADQTITGSAVDVSAYKGNATIVTTMGGAVNEAAGYTNTVTIQHATASTGTWSTVTNLAGTAATETVVGATGEVDTYPIDLGRLHKYIRAVSVQQNDAGSVGVTLVAPMKSE
jgi:hypothetical protein